MCHWRGAILQSFLFFSMILVFCFNLHYVIFTYFTLIRSIYIYIYIYIYILGDGPIDRRPNSPKGRFYSDRSSINGLHPVFKHFQWIVFEYHDFSETHSVYWAFWLSGLRTIGLSDYLAFGLSGRHHILHIYCYEKLWFH